jgi:hypothetical protein
MSTTTTKKTIVQPADDHAITPASISTALAIQSTAALAPVTSGQRELARKLDEINMWLSLPFVSARAIATETEAAGAGKGSPFLFTLERFGEAEFEGDEKDETTGEPIMQPAYLWLATAQSDLTYFKNSGDPVDIAKGERFIVSQRPNRLREKIMGQVTQILDNEGAIPNVTMKFVPLSAKGKAKGWSRAVTFTVVDPDVVPA